MRVTNWGMFLLGIYLIITGLNAQGAFESFSRYNGLIGLIAGILILVENWRR